MRTLVISKRKVINAIKKAKAVCRYVAIIDNYIKVDKKDLLKKVEKHNWDKICIENKEDFKFNKDENILYIV